MSKDVSNHRKSRRDTLHVPSSAPTLSLPPTTGGTKRTNQLPVVGCQDPLMTESNFHLSGIEETSRETDETNKSSAAVAVKTPRNSSVDSTIRMPTESSIRGNSDISSLATNETPSVAMMMMRSQQQQQKSSKHQNQKQKSAIPSQSQKLTYASSSRPSSSRGLPIAETLSRSLDTRPIGKQRITDDHKYQESFSRNNHHPPPPPPRSSRNQRNRRSGSAFSSLPSSSMNSSVASSWDSMSQSVYSSVYTTASAIVRHPAWGHNVLGLLVFFGWMIHHWYFSEYMIPRSYGRMWDVNNGQHPLLHEDLQEGGDVKQKSWESSIMLRGSNGKEYEDLNDYPLVRPVRSAFDVIEGPPLWERMKDEPVSKTSLKRVSKFQAKVGTDDDMSDPRKETSDPTEILENEKYKESSTFVKKSKEMASLSDTKAQRYETASRKKLQKEDTKTSQVLSETKVKVQDYKVNESVGSESSNTNPMDHSVSNPITEEDVTTQEERNKEIHTAENSTETWKETPSEKESPITSMGIPTKQSSEVATEGVIIAGGIMSNSTEGHANNTITYDMMTTTMTEVKSSDAVPGLWNVPNDPVDSLTSV
jgi:hypothetical protein